MAATASNHPFDRVYQTRDILLKTLREFAISQGYVVTISRSSPERNIYIGCDKGGSYRDRVQPPDRQKRRRTNTRRTGCQFQLYCRKGGGPTPDEFWRVKVLHGEHNHDFEEDLVEHPGARVMTEDQKKMVQYLVSEKMPPRKIVAALKQGYPDLLILTRDVYNIKGVMRREERERRLRELPEERAKREKLEKLAAEHREQREQLEREQLEQRKKLEDAQKEQREHLEQTGQIQPLKLPEQSQSEHPERQNQQEELRQLQQLQQLQQFEQLEELANHVQGRV